MCCGPDTLLWFALSVFWVADMIGIDGHVSFLPQKKKGKKRGHPAVAGKPAGKNEGMLTQQDEPGCEHQRLPIRAGVRGKLQRLIGRLSRMGTSSALEASRHGSVRLITARWLDAWQVASCDMRMICQFMQVVLTTCRLKSWVGLAIRTKFTSSIFTVHVLSHKSRIGPSIRLCIARKPACS